MNESFNDHRSRKNGPPISGLRSRSPKSSYVKSLALTNDNTFSSNGNSIPPMLNQSNRNSKPYENVSIRESDSYSRFLNKSMTVPETNDDYDNWVTVFG